MTHDFDLVPDEYRQQVQFYNYIRIFCFGYLILLCVLLAGWTLLSFLQNTQNQAIDTLQNAKQIWITRQKQLTELEHEKYKLEKWLDIFDSLHGRPSAKQVIGMLDRALNENIWFSELKFQRTMKKTRSNESGRPSSPIKFESAQSSDPFGITIDIPITDTNATKERLQVGTHLTIHGEALDHSYLASFLRDLLEQPEVAQGRIEKTNSRRHQGYAVVGYEIALSLHNMVEKKP